MDLEDKAGGRNHGVVPGRQRVDGKHVSGVGCEVEDEGGGVEWWIDDWKTSWVGREQEA